MNLVTTLNSDVTQTSWRSRYIVTTSTNCHSFPSRLIQMRLKPMIRLVIKESIMQLYDIIFRCLFTALLKAAFISFELIITIVVFPGWCSEQANEFSNQFFVYPLWDCILLYFVLICILYYSISFYLVYCNCLNGIPLIYPTKLQKLRKN